MMIRNFWEVHGSFEGIESTVLHRIIKKLSDEAGMPYKDYLYMQLGYKPLAQYSLEESCELRALFVTRQYKELKEKLGLNSTKDVQDFFKKEGVSSVSFDLKDKNTDHKYDDIVDLLAAYYRNDSSLYCIVGDRPLPFFYCLETLSNKSTSPDKLVDSLMNDKWCLGSLAKIQCRKDSTLRIQGKKCISPIEYSTEEKTRIQHLALKKACFPYGVNLNKLFKSAPDLVFLSFNNNEKYLKLLDFARSTGITYQDLAQNYGINVADQLPVFSKYGILLYKFVEGTSYIIDAECDEKNNPYKEGSLYFN